MKARATSPALDIDSGDESDGQTALCTIEDRDQPKAARRGPLNASMAHYHNPTPFVKQNKEVPVQILSCISLLQYRWTLMNDYRTCTVPQTGCYI